MSQKDKSICHPGPQLLGFKRQGDLDIEAGGCWQEVSSFAFSLESRRLRIRNLIYNHTREFVGDLKGSTNRRHRPAPVGFLTVSEIPSAVQNSSGCVVLDGGSLLLKRCADIDCAWAQCVGGVSSFETPKHGGVFLLSKQRRTLKKQKHPYRVPSPWFGLVAWGFEARRTWGTYIINGAM